MKVTSEELGARAPQKNKVKIVVRRQGHGTLAETPAECDWATRGGRVTSSAKKLKRLLYTGRCSSTGVFGAGGGGDW